MKIYSHAHALVTLFTLSVLIVPPAQAQTPPTPTTTFNQTLSTAWTDAGNWDLGVPDAADDAWIGAGKTAVVTQAYLDTAPFGTLTLGAGSTLQLSAANNTGLPANSLTYFDNGSTLEFTAGTQNRANNFHILAGATASCKMNNNTIPQGTWSGDGDLFNVIIGGTTHLRATVTFTGDVTFSPNIAGQARNVNITGFGTAPIVGPGVTTYNNGVYTVLQAANRIHDSATLNLVGGTGGSSTKLAIGNNSDTISNLIIESPTGTGDTVDRGTGVLTVTNLMTFQGTAGTCVLDDTQATPSGNGLVAKNMTFAGTGEWVLYGDCGIGISGGTITTDADATISNKLTAASGFTKTGTNSLTLGDPSGVATEIAISGGHIVVATSVTFTASDYVLFKAQDTSFGAGFGGSFADINAVNATLSPTGSFRKEDGVSGGMSARDNGDGTFTVKMGPPGGTVLIVR